MARRLFAMVFAVLLLVLLIQPAFALIDPEQGILSIERKGCTVIVEWQPFDSGQWEVSLRHESRGLIGTAVYPNIMEAGVRQAVFQLEGTFDGSNGSASLFYAPKPTTLDIDPFIDWPEGDECADGSSVPQETFFDPGDDRINTQPYANIAVYCDEADGEIVVYRIDENGEGTEILSAPYSAFEGTSADSMNTLVGEGGGAQIFHLASGAILVNGGAGADGKGYFIVFDGCEPNYLNAYVVENGVPVLTEQNTF